MKSDQFKESNLLPPPADGPQPYDAFWNKFVDSQPDDWVKEVTRTMIKNLPAEWLQDIADVGTKVQKEMNLVDDDELDYCITHAIARLLEAYINCKKGRRVFIHGCSSIVAVEVFKRCIETMARD
jgi:hypothetical protein